MSISEKQFKVVFTNDCIDEINQIYDYISKKLYAPNSAKKIMMKIDNAIQSLKNMPELYSVIKKYPELNREYRRIVIKNYVLLYTISKKENTIYIVHMFYGRSNYFNKI